MSEILQLLAGALVMIGLLGLAGQWAPSVLRLFAWRPAPTAPKASARVRVLETQELDGGRRLTLVRWDDREHLILSGGDEDLVIETREVRRTLQPLAQPHRGS